MLMYVNVYSVDTTLDVNFLYNFADINLLSEIKRVDGVGFADILGDREYAMRIWLKPDRMLAYKISADEVLAALDEQSLEAAWQKGYPAIFTGMLALLSEALALLPTVQIPEGMQKRMLDFQRLG